MIRLVNLTLVLSLWIFLASCGKSAPKDQDLPPYNPYIEAFTTGNISRYSSVYLVLNQDVPSGRQDAGRLKDRIRIQPKVAGQWHFQDARTLVFKPGKNFERNTSYKVTADLSGWFEGEEEDQKFSFGFSTLPLDIRGYLASFDLNAKNENGYDLTFALFTPDKESPETVEALTSFSENPGKIIWKHGADGKKHEVTLSALPAGAEGERTLSLSVQRNKWGVEERVLARARIPGQHDFSVYDVSYVSDPERYVEITFTKALDPGQDLRGLAFIEGNSSETFHVEGNKLRLYPDEASLRKETMQVHLTQGIRSREGLALGKAVIRQVEAGELKPDVRFIGKGVIIPGSDQLSVPFQSVYLRGVTVSVIKILEQNIGQFLQTNQLDENMDLMRVGRLVARQTIFLDEEGVDLSRWNTFAIDLRRLIEPEPGAIYRLELSFDRQLSAYPCGTDSVEVIPKERILAMDEARFKEEAARFDEGGYYYYRQYDWSDYNWQKRDDPCSESYYYNKVVGKNVMATHIGLIAFMGQDNRMTVLAHDLLDTRPEKGVTVNAYNYQRQLLTSATTDEEGRAALDLSSGKAFYLIASRGKQRSYLRVDNGSALSLSTFDVSGEVVQRGIKGFIYGERGVWRPGDTLHIGFMLNDKLKQLPKDHPVVMELYNPLGQLYARQTQTRGKMGLYAFDFPTDPDSPTGAWNIKAHVGGVSFSKRIRIESIKPNRLKIDLTMPRQILSRGEPIDARLHVEWLQGALARNMKYDIQGTFISTPTSFKGYESFCFEDPSRQFRTEESKLLSGTTDGEGNARIQARLELGGTAPGMLLANLVTKVYEESGNFSIDADRVIYSPYRRYVGIRPPQKEGERLDTGRSYTYEVASVDYLGQGVADTELEVKVYKVAWHWWWDSNENGLANYISDSYNKPIKRFTLRTDNKGKGSFRLEFPDKEWGTYFISVKDKDGGHSTGLMSYFDWPSMEGRRDANGSESATQLRFKIDKESYAPGERMIVTFPSSKGSRAIISVENGTRVLSLEEHSCEERQTTVRLEVTEEMRPNAYVRVILLQPHGVTGNDLPIRLYGVVPFTVNSPESHLSPVIQVPREIKPEHPYTLSVSEKNGKEMAYTLAIVDEGLLDLTRFATPDPWSVFNAREALGVNTWDLYNLVVGAYGGRIEQLFSIGGDDALDKGPKAIANRFKPVVRFEGPFVLKRGETARHTYQMPNYTGRVRVMVVAGDGEAYGCADKSVLVRKPVMLLGTLPRVIGVGEEMEVPATVFATEDGVGSVKVSVACGSNMEVIGESSKTLYFERKGDQQTSFRIRVKGHPGVGKVTITAIGKGDRSVYDTELEIRTTARPQMKVTPITIEPGKSWEGSISLPGASGTNRLTLEASRTTPLNLSARLSYLSAYPHGCLEQCVSKGFPLLSLSSFANLESDESETAEVGVKEVIHRLRSYQTVEGSFAYWPGSSDTQGWATAYATHFLLKAGEKGYLVPEAMRQSALSYLRRAARNWKPVASYSKRSEEQTQAYRLYVLALARTSEIGAMNRLKEVGDLAPISRWLLASAYALAGRVEVAKELIRQTSEVTSGYTEYDMTFGSDLRDKAIQLLVRCLLDEGGEAYPLAEEISARLASDEWLSTQSVAFALVAFSDYITKYGSGGSMDFSYACGNQAGQVRTDKQIWAETLSVNAEKEMRLRLRNSGTSTLFARVIGEGTPIQGEEQAYSNGISLAVRYTDMNGRPIDVTRLEQGTNFSAVVTVRNPSSRGYTNLVLSEIFPAGWEILNTRFLENTVKDSLVAGVNYQDRRDDRVYSYMDRLPAGREITVKIDLCAVYKGRFYQPPINCEAMYDQRIRANTEGRKVTVL